MPSSRAPPSATTTRGTDSFTLWTTSQNPHVARLVLAAFIGLAPEHKLRVIAPDVGGGFGSKIFIYAEETVCLWASKKVGRPVKWVAERTEAFLADAHGRDHVTTAELAVDAGGKILALRAKTKANLGGYLSTFASSVPTYLYAPLLSGQYDIPAIYCEVDGVYTNTAPVDAYRGAGRPEATFVVERLVEVAARETGKDPAEFRRQNFIKSFPHATPVIMTYDAGDYAACLDKALEMADYKGLGARKAASAKNGKKRGIGFSAYIEACGIAPSAAVGSLGAGVGLWESAEVRVNPTGSVEVLTGSHSHGQGHETTFAQLTSQRLGIPIEQITVVHGDTDKVQFGMGTYGSRSGAVGMSAIYYAIDKVIVKAKKVAGFVLEVPHEPTSTSRTASSRARPPTRRSPSPRSRCRPTSPTSSRARSSSPASRKAPSSIRPTSPSRRACTSARWRSIPRPAPRRIERWTAVDDFGTLVNPMIVEGQVHGGIAQGVGQALLEGAVYDKEGQLLTASYMDYCMPRAGDLPSYQVAMVSTPCPSNPLGIKGCGEAGAIAAPAAVINAITDALGHEQIAMPATPRAVWRAAQKAPAKMAAE